MIARLSLAAALLLGGTAQAQCLSPDLLDSAPCCTPVLPALPGFPPASLNALGICWDACSVDSQVCLTVSLGAPNPTLTCGRFNAPLSVTDCAGVALLSANAALDYSRTWEETGSGTIYQVWRFLLKADLAPVPGTPTGCTVPTCIGPQPTAFYHGYVDYAFDCSTGGFQSSLVLYHGCDELQHRPGLSAHPGVFHPFDSYAIVAPHTSADPFVPSVLPPALGTLMGDAVRDTVSPLLDFCPAEEPLTQGVLQPLIQACLCPASLFFPPQMTLSQLSGAALCGSGFGSVNFWPTAPWFEMVTIALGRWSGAAYPGPETAAVTEGIVIYDDACSSTGVITTTADVMYGAQTTGGYLVTPLDATLPPPNHFLDLGSNYTVPASGPVPLPILGTVGPTEHLIQVNAY